jgi:DNA repair protein RecO
MSHTIHRTKAYVLATSPSGEANMFVDLLTEELGLVRATAQGIRFLKSKLRYSVTPYSLIETSLVRGKEVWRLVGASKIHDFFFEFSEEKKILFFTLSHLIRRLVQGEEPHSDLFQLIENLGDFLFEKSLDLDITLIQDLTVLRLLSLLGYIAEKEEYAFCISNLVFTSGLLEDFNKIRDIALLSINQALSESGL